MSLSGSSSRRDTSKKCRRERPRSCGRWRSLCHPASCLSKTQRDEDGAPRSKHFCNSTPCSPIYWVCGSETCSELIPQSLSVKDKIMKVAQVSKPGGNFEVV